MKSIPFRLYYPLPQPEMHRRPIPSDSQDLKDGTSFSQVLKDGTSFIRIANPKIDEYTRLFHNESEAESHDVPILSKIVRSLRPYKKCYLRIFDGLRGDYSREKREMELYVSIIPVFRFLDILKRARLEIDVGEGVRLPEEYSNPTNPTQFIRVIEHFRGERVIVVHQVLCKGIRGTICSRYFTFRQGPPHFEINTPRFAVCD